MSMQRDDHEGVAPAWHLGDRLAKALDHAHVSNYEMAEYLGVSRNTIGNYLALRSPVSIGTLRNWATRTQVSLRWLETGEGSHTSPEKPPGGAEPDELAALTERKRGRAGTRGSDTHRYVSVA